MKKIIITLLTAFIFSCSPDLEIEQAKEKSTPNQMGREGLLGKIGDPTKTPDLRIEEFAPTGKYQGEGTIGLRVPLFNSATYAIYPTEKTNQPYLLYGCIIENAAPIDYSGQNDFVVCKPCDGIENTLTGNYEFPGIISIVTYQNGLPIAETIKQVFDIFPTYFTAGYDFNQQIRWDYPNGIYNPDYMFIAAGTADKYNNRAFVKEGKNLIVVEVNPDLKITETNYNNNVSTLPVNVGPIAFTTSSGIMGKASLDLSAIEENKAHAVINLTAVISRKYKTLTLDWDCPYHEPFYVKHYFTIKENGVVIADKVEHSEFVKTYKGNLRQATYEVTVTVVGLGTSPPTTIIK